MQNNSAEIRAVIETYKKFFNSNSIGFESFITENTDDIILERISKIENEPLTYVQLNQLLSFGKVSAISDGFYQYYWMISTLLHPYDITKLPEYQSISFDKSNILTSLQLQWGIHRIIIDCIMFFGNINTGFSFLHDKSLDELKSYFISKRYDTSLISGRGEPLKFNTIEKEDRYLISEMACKTYGNNNPDELEKYLVDSYREARKIGITTPKIKDLLEGKYIKVNMNIDQLTLSLSDIFEDSILDESEIKSKCSNIVERFTKARTSAISNTRLFLSLVHDLDVYMATSMRTKADFIKIAETCENIFSDNKVKSLKIRYFDPTISAAEGHEDKGLIECLMVKCCKVLVYSAGEKDSWGKDAEAAMALSLGKPVIFLCDNESKLNFYKDIHPLSRLIDFSNGVANGAIIAKSTSQVSELLWKIFSNDMQYELKQKSDGFYTIIETLTGSVVRLQTNDKFLSNSFWNYYNDKSSNISLKEKK